MYPGWANGIGWLIAMTAILSVPLMAVVTVVAAYQKRPEEGIFAAFNRFYMPILLFQYFLSSISKTGKNNAGSTGRSSTPLTGDKMLPRQTGEPFFLGGLKNLLVE